ncbi:MAG: TatD family hydrolase [Actinomycetales bacterium]|nr:TatD family hydrolase [Actinomycetales bacterium]
MSRRADWPDEPEPLPGPVVDNHTHLETVLRDTDGGGWRTRQGGEGADDGAPGADGAAEQRPTTTDSARLREHLDRATRAGVTRMVQVGCDLESVAWTDQVVRAHPELLGAVAIHPNEAVLHAGVHEVAPDGLDPDPHARHEVPLDEAIARVEAAARGNDRIRCIGETGLDFFRAGERGRAVQREAFRAHIALAKELDLVLQIHDRDAHEAVVEVLEADGAPERTVFHCYSGDAELARRCATHGWYLSFAGPLTFKANDELRRAADVVGPGLSLLETDAPYLTPHPYRGRPNAPYLAALTVRTLAEVQGIMLEEACAAVDRNAEDLYGPWE